MTIDDQDALGAVKDQLRGAEGVLRLILEHDNGENIEAVRGAYELVDASLDKVRAILKAHERA
ncbi:MAG: hypothetical protein PGN16_03790 [Sphingomonas phyllosphaerae]|uniref:hypothetical protein n=1 Tax=Sphingomonas phyllosphaerae TaxID=257003 RepID=UPI002FFC4C33